jgi:hypothetical protein
VNCDFLIDQFLKIGMHYIYTLQTILIGLGYGLIDVKNVMVVGYHGKKYMNWLEKLVVMEIPMLRRGK